MEQREIMTLLVDRLEHGNQRQFAFKTKIQPATINRLMKGIVKLNERYIDLILAAYPSVSSDFLHGQSDDTGLPETVRETYAHTIEMKDLEIKHLKDKVELLTWMLENVVKQ